MPITFPHPPEYQYKHSSTADDSPLGSFGFHKPQPCGPQFKFELFVLSAHTHCVARVEPYPTSAPMTNCRLPAQFVRWDSCAAALSTPALPLGQIAKVCADVNRCALGAITDWHAWFKVTKGLLPTDDGLYAKQECAPSEPLVSTYVPEVQLL